MSGKTIPGGLPQWQEQLLQRHRLPRDYLAHAQQWFAPLARALCEHQFGARRPVLVALNGCQGSGKSTVCDYLCALLDADFGIRTVSLSLDDFYLTRDQRQALAKNVHPLLATRGVPGTHDMTLLQRTLDALLHPVASSSVAIPRFDKAVDDRFSEADWDRVEGGIDLVLLEGWCMGARPQTAAELITPVNALERDEDTQGRWRGYVNKVLEQEFEPLYRRIDQWVMLRAPSFDCVFRWRMEQEQKLADRTAGDEPNRIMDEAQVARFIQHYERLTQGCLEHLQRNVHHLYWLDEQRGITGYSQRRSLDS